ncbi:lipopolysaccharide biosynthesis protein [Microbacterium sp. W4I20]|uniref:lipopolysaccharide biosynthesis protein n=1 Tax=Microbacterium sp. W4I20 TaxID=3042262 RepID=UPI00278400B3|nr:oligosaccharide flippase family protein [Microbacterium sp. W4I20]MDQ0726307.1 O-antigen/teichoic acid export membrane protein [Microbacterium sp. W4I20]
MGITSIWARLRSRGAKGALSLILGTGVAQGITLLVTPFLTRLYSDEDFGYLSLVIAVVSIAAPAAALRLDSALMLPRAKRDASALFGTGLLSALVVSALTVGLLQALFAFGLLPNMSALPWFSVWVGGITFLTAAFTLLSQYALRGHRYGAVARRSIYQSVLAAGAQLAGGFFAPSPVGLIGGYAIGRAAGIAPLAIGLRSEIERFSLADVRRLMREYWRFPVLFAPSAVLNSAGLVVPVIFVGLWFSVADAGQWALADRILAAPLVLVATAVGQVVEAHMSEMIRESRGGLTRYYLSVSAVLALVAVVTVVAVVFLVKPILPLFLGSGWETAGELMVAMSPIIATRLIVSPMSKVLIVLQRGGWNLGLDVLRVVLVLGVVATAVLFAIDLITTAWLFSLALSSVYVVTWVIGMMATRRDADRAAA